MEEGTALASQRKGFAVIKNRGLKDSLGTLRVVAAYLGTALA